MPLSGWLTFVLVTLILYGGFVWCLWIAFRAGGGDEEDQG